MLRLAVLAFILWLAVLASKFLSGLLLGHTMIYGARKQTHNKEKEIKVLPLSLNQEKLRKEGRKDIFGRFLDSVGKNDFRNGVVKFGGNWRIFGA